MKTMITKLSLFTVLATGFVACSEGASDVRSGQAHGTSGAGQNPAADVEIARGYVIAPDLEGTPDNNIPTPPSETRASSPTSFGVYTYGQGSQIATSDQGIVPAIYPSSAPVPPAYDVSEIYGLGVRY